MKKLITLFFLFLICQLNAQNKSLKQFDVTVSEIEIDTEGLDEIILENSDTNKVTVFLDDQNSFSHSIFTSEEGSILKINFQPKVVVKNNVFRKFITKRINRASVKIKVPKNKNLTFLGNEIDIISKKFIGNLSIYIDKGELQLGNLVGSTDIKLYSGNVSAKLNNTSIIISSTLGKIIIDGKFFDKNYKKEQVNTTDLFSVKSIKANIVLSSQKTQ